MSDNDQIEALYREMYKAMVEKDTATLNRVHADNFVLTHMTGMHQSKQEYIRRECSPRQKITIIFGCLRNLL